MNKSETGRTTKQKNLDIFYGGTLTKAYEFFGAHPQGDGVMFRVYAPQAREIFLVGDFNLWQRKNRMEKIDQGGVWELLVKGVKPFDSYKYCIITPSGEALYKADPYGFHCEKRPETASKYFDIEGFIWDDRAFMENRKKPSLQTGPFCIYEVHFGSFRKEVASYRQFAEVLIPYVKEMGYTHLELMPMMEYPYDPSWGYQVTGYFAPTSRYGTPHELMWFVNRCHQEGLGVILDWVPAHYPKDEAGLYRWDGSHLYEYENEKKRYHHQWGTAVFDWGKPHVRSFLISNALYWLNEYHFDGIRVDAVSSMLYLDYNRLEGEWEPNQFGGNENLEAVSFLRELNQKVKEEAPDCMMIAEESTAWPAVTAPVESGGLGFDYKWNMGWMNDTLKYMTMEEEDRTRNAHRMTFPITYAFGEKYILPLSHDEVVHLKGSILQKMPGNKEEKLMQLRAYIGYMMAHPGKKLLFMGGEMAQETEWDYKGELPWSCLEQPDHENYFQMIKSLNHFYRNTPALWQLDHEPKGFEWIDVHKAKEGLLLFERLDLQGNRLIVVSNFSKKIMRDIPLPRGDHYQVAFSTNPNPGAITITEKGITIPGYTTGFITREVE